MKLSKYLNENFDTIKQYVSDAEMLRESIILELDAINRYKMMAEKAKSPEVRKVLLHVAEEEKHHIGEFQAMLEKLDPDHTEGLEHGKEDLEDMGIKV